MEDKVEFLQNELVKFAESFAELTYHYSTLHNFMIFQFGDVFKNFVLAESGDDKRETAGADVKSKEEQRESEGGEHGESNEHSFEDGNEQNNEAELVDNDYNEDAEQSDVDCLNNLLDVDIKMHGEEEDEEEDEEQQMVQITRVPQAHSSLQSQHYPKAARPGYSGLQTAGKFQPPPLLRRPINPHSSHFRTQLKGPGQLQPRLSATTGRLIRQPSSVSRIAPPSINQNQPTIGGNRGNEVLLSNDDEDFKAGKYAKFYRKVNEELIQCKMCNKVLKRRGKFIQHLRTHTGEKPFQCDYCPAAFSRKDNMNVHVAKHHTGTSTTVTRPSSGRMTSTTSNSLYGYHCQFCFKQFANENIFQAHLQLVHGLSSGDNAAEGGEDGMEDVANYVGEYEEDGGEEDTYYEEEEDVDSLQAN